MRNTLTSPQSSLFVARDTDADDLIVGTVVATVVHTPDDVEGRIDDVAVLGEYRGNGIAKTLMKNTIAHLTEAGVLDIELTCAPHREAAGHLYEGLGFTERKTRVYKLHVKD